MTEHRIPAIALPSWMRAAARCGFNVEPILAGEGIELDLVQIADSQVPLAALDRALERCVAAGGRAHFPFAVGEAFAFEYLPELETYLTTSSSLRDAARVLDWIPALVNPFIRTRLVETRSDARLEYQLEPDARRQTKPYYAEMFFATILKFVRSLAGPEPGLQALHFSHPPPSYADRYEPFFGLPVAFGCSRDELLFQRGALDRRLEGDFPRLHKQAEALVAERVAQRRSQPVTQRVLGLLTREPALLAGGLDAVAKRLALGPRTLQRRLRDEHTSFAELRETAMRRQAERWLADGVALERIAERLGFADRRSFTRAFKRWAGETPSAYRKRLAAADAG